MRVATQHATYRIYPFGREREDAALPVRSLSEAAQFFAHVLDMTPVERPREDHRVVLQRHNFRLALYRIPGYVPTDSTTPVLAFRTERDDVIALRDRVMFLEGIILDDAADAESPRLLFMDPAGTNVIECIGY